MRETSLAAYHSVMNDGIVARMQRAAYELLYNHGPLTGREIDRIKNDCPDFHKRLPELRDAGLAREVGTRICQVTGRVVIAWDVTSAMPVPAIRVRAPTKIKWSACCNCLQMFRPGMVTAWGNRLKFCPNCNGELITVKAVNEKSKEKK